MRRRDLWKLAGSGLALGLAQSLPAQDAKPVNYCMVGLGTICVQHFGPACKTARLSRVTAVVTGHREKGDKAAAEYGFPAKNIYSYDNFDAIADNKDIDAVYIGLPNSMHAEYTIRAAKAGKHVLCEKPMATTVADSQAMIDACKKANKKLMIAYRCQLEPTNLRAIELIRSGALGKVQAIESANGFNIGRNQWRTNGKLAGGGPLMDMGVYSLNACRYLTGEEPVEIHAVASVIDQDGRFADVEENVAWTMKFPSGAVASCNTTYGANMSGFFRVHGSRGVMNVDNAFGYSGQTLSARIQGQPPIDEPNPAKDPSHFVAEADHFSECILQNKEPKPNGEEGLRDMKIVEKIYQSAGRKLG